MHGVCRWVDYISKIKERTQELQINQENTKYLVFRETANIAENLIAKMIEENHYILYKVNVECNAKIRSLFNMSSVNIYVTLHMNDGS